MQLGSLPPDDGNDHALILLVILHLQQDPIGTGLLDDLRDLGKIDVLLHSFAGDLGKDFRRARYQPERNGDGGGRHTLIENLELDSLHIGLSAIGMHKM